ncbi:MAG: hypothetical protein GFH25_541218n33 [Chloroflexi bacterium AL-N10]|nr:hypothetical protein [Chloroflexi bacterium AL-N1]NOK69895.1 hypothetical protein [Chloroflexi bacterium AL-N10]NOK73808.1 hypothetical protein [Chloroflexi bacterium AL-N5]NOK91628.1 hypothetical protein [Chloroflexi bacterium AL-N15]
MIQKHSIHQHQDYRVPTLHFHLFGPFILQCNHTSLTLPTSLAAQTLLAYLLLHAQRKHTRLYLIGIFWPDLPEHQARRKLSQVLWHVRRHIPDLIQSDHETLYIQPETAVWIDVHLFESLVDPLLNMPVIDRSQVALLRQACQLYSHDLLEDFYDDWVLIERERLREKYRLTLQRLLASEKASGRFEAALDSVLQLLRIDPLHEEYYCEAMRLYSLLGRIEDALQQFNICCRMLDTELGLGPDAVTVVLKDDILRRSKRCSDAYLPDIEALQRVQRPLLAESADDLPLIHRTNEHSQLLRWLECIFEGTGQIVLIEGEAGVGKSRLIREIAKDLQWRGADVLWGRGKPSNTHSPYAVLIDAIAQGLTPLRAEQLASLIPVEYMNILCTIFPILEEDQTERLPHTASRKRAPLYILLAHLLAAWSRIRPLVLILDDLQLVNVKVWQSLSYFHDHLCHDPVVVIGAYRCEDILRYSSLWKQLQQLVRGVHSVHIELTRLDSAATGEIIQKYLGKPDPTFAQGVYHVSQGNPLFIIEFLYECYHQQLLQINEQGLWQLAKQHTIKSLEKEILSSSIRQLLTRRFTDLPPPIRRVLDAMAILEEPCPFKVLMAVCNLDTSTALCYLNQLVQQRLLIETVAGYCFPCAMLRHIVYEHISADRRVVFHRRAGKALSAIGIEQYELLAHHFMQGQVWELAAKYLLLSGEHAYSCGYPLTAEFYVRSALALVQSGHTVFDQQTFFVTLLTYDTIAHEIGHFHRQEQYLSLLEGVCRNAPEKMRYIQSRRIRLLAMCGRFDEAGDLAQTIMAGITGDQDREVYIMVVTTLTRIVCWRNASLQTIMSQQTMLDQCLNSNTLSKTHEAHVHNALASLYFSMQLLSQADYHSKTALVLYEHLDEKYALTEALLIQGRIACSQNQFTESNQCYQRALNMAQTYDYSALEHQILVWCGWSCFLQEQVSQAFTYSEAVWNCISQEACPVLLAWSHLNTAFVHCCYLGMYGQAQHHIEQIWDYINKTDDLHLAGMCHAVLGALAYHAGNRDVACRYLTQAVHAPIGIYGQWSHLFAYLLLAQLVLDAGQYEAALEYADTADAICKDGAYTPWWSRLAAVRCHILLALNQTEAALARIEKHMSYVSSDQTIHYQLCYAHYCVLCVTGNFAQAYQALEQAYTALMRCLAGLSPACYQSSVTNVPEYRTIVMEWEAYQPQKIEVVLPRIDAPTGRALRDDEQTTVSWTIRAPDDQGMTDSIACRRFRIRRLIQEALTQGAIPTAKHLAEALCVGQRTVEQDLALLRREDPTLSTSRCNKARKQHIRQPAAEQEDAHLFRFIVQQTDHDSQNPSSDA